MGIEMEEHDFGLGTVIFDPKNDVDFLGIGNTKKVWWICEKRGHRFEATYNNLVKNKGCPICASNILKDYSKLPHKEMIQDITKNWESNYQRSQKKADAQMYSSLLNPKNRKLIETVIDKSTLLNCFQDKWKIIYEENNKKIYEDVWENYFNSFKTIVFQKQIN